MISPTIFKSYDIRAKAPEEINETVARRLGKTLTSLSSPKKVVIGRDMRETSPALEEALVEGFLASGVDVTRIGLCSTPMFNFAVNEASGAYDLGVMITASHNPAAYNGFKMLRGDGSCIGQGSGMEAIRNLMLSEEPLLDHTATGTATSDTAILERYLDHVFRLAALPAKLPAWTIIVDAGNGMNGMVMPAFAKHLSGPKLVPLYWELDGTFPNHDANPQKSETLRKASETILKYGAAFGVAFDGDGDRVGFIDEQGTPIRGDITTALLARELLRKHPGAKIFFDVRSSRSVAEVVREAGGEPIMTRVGSPHMKNLMRENGGIFGGEMSMHFCFSELWNAESGDYGFLLFLQMLMREQKPLSAIWRELDRYAHSGEINFTVKDPKSIIQKLDEAYGSDATNKSYLDGLRVDFPEWWFNVRASNTEPLLRLNLEANTKEQMEKHKEELTRIIIGG